MMTITEINFNNDLTLGRLHQIRIRNAVYNRKFRAGLEEVQMDDRYRLMYSPPRGVAEHDARLSPETDAI